MLFPNDSLEKFLSDVLLILSNVKCIFRIVIRGGKTLLKFHERAVRFGRTFHRLLSGAGHLKLVSPPHPHISDAIAVRLCAATSSEPSQGTVEVFPETNLALE